MININNYIFLLALCVFGLNKIVDCQTVDNDTIKKLRIEEDIKSAVAYINKYKYIAISEMLLHGIPASIKIAQGLVETDNGRSELCKNTNNHFGIKCHKGWNGETYHYNDDKPQECFRKYNNPYESYRDHSLFLRSRPWYSFLFTLNRYDYKGWAYGLKRAGYATNPKYAEVLIQKIEMFKLYEYDHYDFVPYNPNDIFIDTIISSDSINVSKITVEVKPCKCEDKIDYFNEFAVGTTTRKICLNNNIKYTIARKGDTYYRIAKDFKIPLSDIYIYNELSNDAILKPGQIIYLERKKRKTYVDYHIVKKGQTLYDISQQYGIKIGLLYRRNGIDKNYKLKEGQKIWLNKKMRL